MKNILKTLETDKAEIEKKFGELNQRRQELITATNQTSEEMVRLQGEHRKVLKLIEDFRDEPKEK